MHSLHVVVVMLAIPVVLSYFGSWTAIRGGMINKGVFRKVSLTNE